MEIRNVLPLRGPNVWSRKPVLEVDVDLQERKGSLSSEWPGFNDRLVAWLPGIAEHPCRAAKDELFSKRLRAGTNAAEILGHVTMELQALAGAPVDFIETREMPEQGLYRVVVEFDNQQLVQACLSAARELLECAIFDRPFDLPAELGRLRELGDSVLLGPSTAAIVAAASARDIPSQRLNSGSLVQLGYGSKQHRVWTAETDRTSAIAESIAQDKDLTKVLLRAAGVPVPEGRPVVDETDAWAAACEVGVPVVVKPRDGNHGRGVFVDLNSRDEVVQAFGFALKQGSGVIVEKFAHGAEHRLLVVGDKVVAASRGEAAYVVGDGLSSIRELIELQLNSDPRRGDDYTSPLAKICPQDADLILQLQKQQLTIDAVPKSGARVLIQRSGNLAFDVTAQVHPEVADRAVQAAQAVGLDIAGLDVVVLNVARPLEEQGGVVVEVNAGPGLIMHLKPSNGPPQPVGEAIVDLLFPASETGRIPIACIAGTHGQDAVARLLEHMLRCGGIYTGLDCADGIYANGRRIAAGSSGVPSACPLLLNPRIDAMVFEVGTNGILREGLRFDRCDVAVVTSAGEADGSALPSSHPLERVSSALRLGIELVLPGGTAILNATESPVAEMASHCPGNVLFYAVDGAHPRIVEHRKAGKRVVFVREGQIVMADGPLETTLLKVADVSFASGETSTFQVDRLLAAVGAAWSLGVSPDKIARSLMKA